MLQHVNNPLKSPSAIILQVGIIDIVWHIAEVSIRAPDCLEIEK